MNTEITFRLNDIQKAKLTRLAADRGVSVDRIIHRLLELGLNQLETSRIKPDQEVT